MAVRGKAMIVQSLNEIQARCGYLPVDELRSLAEKLRVPLHRLHEVASFYPRYQFKLPPKVRVQVCRDMSCHLHGASELRKQFATAVQSYDADMVALEGVSCLGRCAQPPAVAINEQIYQGLSESEIRALIQCAVDGRPLPHVPPDRSPLGWRIDPYQGEPRYKALRQAVSDNETDSILREIERADLRGMGGAGFPTARKWAAVRDAAGDIKYVIGNADESEPGTFKDLELLRRTPYLFIEGMILAGLVTGARQGIVYIRHEYHDTIDILNEALKHARENQLLGANILRSQFSFDIDLFVSPGGYIQGEETALLEALEDRRGEPRNKPPYPVASGLFGKPTVINNVETLSWIPAILLNGGEWYSRLGVNGAKGMRFVSISGDVERAGVYEVPFGITVRELIFQFAGGMRGGRRLKAIALSGPSGGFWPAKIDIANLPATFVRDKLPAGASSFDILDLTLDLPTVGAMGGMLGAAFVVYGDQADMVDQTLNCLQFFRDESCGKCVPCRLGTRQLASLIEELHERKTTRTQLEVIPSVAEAMQLTSICGLGMVAANPILSVLKHFPEDVENDLASEEQANRTSSCGHP